MTIREIGIVFGYKIDEASEAKVKTSIKGIKQAAQAAAQEAKTAFGSQLDKMATQVKTWKDNVTSLLDKAKDKLHLKPKVDPQSETEVEDDLKALKEKAEKILGGTVIVVGIKKAVDFAAECVSIASEVSEMESKFDTVFDGINEEVDAWAENFADAVGRNKNDIKTYLANQQNLLIGFGASKEAGAELAEQMTSLALDLASFANIDEADAVNYMTKAVMGESEAAKSLGTITNETTRAQAMQTLGLTGTYDALSQLEKMQVNYQAILSQSEAAQGDCINSLDRYESTTRQFEAKLKEVKQLIGTYFMPTFQKIISFGAKGLTILRDMIQKVADFSDKMGGAENIISAVGIALGLAFAVANKNKIKDLAQMALQFAQKIGLANAAILKFFAIFLIVALVVQDFIAFMKGDNSLIGALFEKAGIDADAMRQKIKDAFENVKTIIKNVADAAKNTLSGAFQSVRDFLKSTFDVDIGSSLGEAIATVIDLVTGFIDVLAKNPDAAKTFGAAIGGIATAFVGLKTAITVIKGFTKIGGIVGNLAKGFLALPGPIKIILLLAAVALIVYKNWDKIKPVIDTVIQAVKDFFAAAGEVVSGIIQTFVDLYNGVKEKIDNVKQAIIDGIQAAIDWITGLKTQAVQWGADIIDGIVQGITGAVGRVKEAVSGVANSIKSFLGFSEPDDGPLSDFHTYMPDMMSLMAEGITNSKDKVKQALRAVTGDMSVIAKANVVSKDTARMANSSNSTSRTINQTVSISNEFNGDRAGQTKSSKAMDKAADDSTAALARALQTAR